MQDAQFQNDEKSLVLPEDELDEENVEKFIQSSDAQQQQQPAAEQQADLSYEQQIYLQKLREIELQQQPRRQDNAQSSGQTRANNLHTQSERILHA